MAELNQIQNIFDRNCERFTPENRCCQERRASPVAPEIITFDGLYVSRTCLRCQSWRYDRHCGASPLDELGPRREHRLRRWWNGSPVRPAKLGRRTSAHGRQPTPREGYPHRARARRHAHGPASPVRARTAPRRRLQRFAAANRLRSDDLSTLHRGVHDAGAGCRAGTSGARNRDRLRIPGRRAWCARKRGLYD